MFTIMNGMLYIYLNDVVYGKRIATAIASKADSTFVEQNGYYTKPIEMVNDKINLIFDVLYEVEYFDNSFREQKIWSVQLKNSSQYDIHDRNFAVEISTNVRYGKNGWTMIDPYCSIKEVKLSWCTKFFIKYVFTKKDNIEYKTPLEKVYEVTKPEFLSFIEKYELEEI